MKLGDRVETRDGWTGKPAMFSGVVDKISATGPNPERPECRVRVKLDKPYDAAGTSFEFLTFRPDDLVKIGNAS